MAAAVATCAVCGAGGVEVHDNEVCGGACSHAACARCISKHIEDHLPRCRADLQMRVPCYGDGCRKFLPQRMVTALCPQSEAVAEAIDEPPEWLEQQQECQICASASSSGFVNAECGHGACSSCWLKHGAGMVERCVDEGRRRLICCHPGCVVPVAPALLLRVAGWEFAEQPAVHKQAASACRGVLSLVDHCLATDRDVVALADFGATVVASLTEPGPVCPICCERRAALLEDVTSCTCRGHSACVSCWLRWSGECLGNCVRERRVAVPCLAANCKERISLRLWQLFAKLCPEVASMEKRLARRRRLAQNELYPEPMQVDCPQPGCVGLGYLGFDTAMCFVCEHVWVPDGNDGAAPETHAEKVMGLTVKRCPKCQEYIEKNGGCDHMTCRCKHEFYWSTLLPYKPTVA